MINSQKHCHKEKHPITQDWLFWWKPHGPQDTKEKTVQSLP